MLRKLGATLQVSTCSFHDIGKLWSLSISENQTPGHNPHTPNSPSRAYHKAHIPEGVELAKQHNHQLIIDVIRQHHGTGLIHYFSNAQKKIENEMDSREKTNGNSHEEDVDESTYRYRT